MDCRPVIPVVRPIIVTLSTRATSTPMRSGEQFGGWELIGDGPLGQGGNSVVWRCAGGSCTSAVIKFLTRFDRYPRFKAEVSFQRELSDHPGVLPLVDSHLPESPNKKDRPWLVTPLAEPVRTHVERSEKKLEATVRAIFEVASTLSDIHERQAAHRDIKPENLFMYSGSAVIGDFGLVSYPGKEPITADGERLGPIHYVAPELIGNADEPLDCRPGDVYALAKTLWVLATGQRYPLPGHLSAYEVPTRLSAFVNHDRAVLLDRLLDSATSLNPNARPSCRDFTAELNAWIDGPILLCDPARISPPVSVRLQQLVEVAERAQKQRDRCRTDTQRILSELHQQFLAMGATLAQAAGISSRSQRIPDGNTNSSLRYFPYRNRQDRFDGGNRCFEECFKTVSGKIIGALGGAVLEAVDPSVGLLTGGLVLTASHREPEYVLRRAVEFTFGSARQEVAVAEFLLDLKTHLPRLADRIAQVLGEENTATNVCGGDIRPDE